MLGTAKRPFEPSNIATIDDLEQPTIQQQLMSLNNTWSKSAGPTQLRNIFIPEYVKKSIYASILDATADLIMETPTTL